MKKKKKTWLLVCCALLSCALCFLIQRWSFRYLEHINARFISPVPNVNTVIRLQKIHKLQGDVLIMGSSMTECIPATDKIAVIGIPGSSFLAALEVMKNTLTFPEETVYVIETDNLFNGINHDVLKRTKEWDFLLFKDSKHFSIAAKPCHLLLSSLYALIRPNIRAFHKVSVNNAIQAPEDLSAVPPLTLQEQTEWKDIFEGIEKIKAMNGKVCFVRLPTRQADKYDQNYAKACKIAKHLNLPVLNFNTESWRNRLEFSDTHHLRSQNIKTEIFREVIARDAKACAR